MTAGYERLDALINRLLEARGVLWLWVSGQKEKAHAKLLDTIAEELRDVSNTYHGFCDQIENLEEKNEALEEKNAALEEQAQRACDEIEDLKMTLKEKQDAVEGWLSNRMAMSLGLAPSQHNHERMPEWI